MALTESLFPMEDQEDHPERVERGDKNTREHSEVGEPGACLTVMGGLAHGFDDRVLGIETREKWGPDQRQGSDQ